MADLKTFDLNNQKRSVCASTLSFTGAKAGAASDLANLPEQTLVTSVTYIPITTGAGAIALSIDGGTAVQSIADTTVATVVKTDVDKFYKTGGRVKVALTGVADTVEGRFVIHYIEIDKTNGEYTQ